MLFRSNGATVGTYDPNTHTVTWTFSGWAAADPNWCRVEFRVNDNVPEGTVLSNTACASEDDSRDQNPANNCSSISGTVLQPSVDYGININSDKNVGQPPLLVQFESLKPLVSRKWWLDLNKRSTGPDPWYVYQYVTPPVGEGKDYDIRLTGPSSD